MEIKIVSEKADHLVLKFVRGNSIQFLWISLFCKRKRGKKTPHKMWGVENYEQTLTQLYLFVFMSLCITKKRTLIYYLLRYSVKM